MKMLHLKYMLLAQMSLGQCVAFGGNKPVSCELENKSIASRSSSGVAQVSNLGNIEITCRVPARPFPTKPGESRNGLTVTTTVYEVSPKGSEKLVPSEALLGGGGSTPDQEYCEFLLHIPLEPAAQDAEARRYLAKIENSMQQEQISDETRRQWIERLKEVIYQHRVGVFRVECHVLDAKRIIGTGTVQLEYCLRAAFLMSDCLELLQHKESAELAEGVN